MKHVKVITLPEYDVDVVIQHVEGDDAKDRVDISTWYEHIDEDGEPLDYFLLEIREARSADIAIEMIKDFSKKSALAFLLAAAKEESLEIAPKN